MNELEKALDIAVRGSLREQVLSAFEEQLRKWQIVMPPTERLVWDFGRKDFYRVGLIECWITNEVEAGYCGKFLFVFDGQTCPLHQHHLKHETFYLLKGRVKMMFDGKELEREAGGVFPVPVGKVHSFTGIGPALLLEISTPCFIEDNYFEDTAIPIGGNHKKRINGE